MEEPNKQIGVVTAKDEAICQEAINFFGIEAQLWKAIEEMAELTNALCKMRRGNDTADIITEIADVMIMMEQLQLYYGKEEVEAERIRKLIRLSERIEKHKEHGTA